MADKQMVEIVSSSRYKIDKKHLRTLAVRILQEKGLTDNHIINIVFVGKKKMKDISKSYKNENEALPVLSFPYEETMEGKKFMGEIFICYPQAILLAAQKEKRVDEILLRLIKHGVENLLK